MPSDLATLETHCWVSTLLLPTTRCSSRCPCVPGGTKNQPVLFLLCRIKSKLFFFCWPKASDVTLHPPAPEAGGAWTSVNLVLGTSQHLSLTFPLGSVTQSKFSFLMWFVTEISFLHRFCVEKNTNVFYSCRYSFDFMLLFRARIVKHLLIYFWNVLASYKNKGEGEVISDTFGEWCIAESTDLETEALMSSDSWLSGLRDNIYLPVIYYRGIGYVCKRILESWIQTCEVVPFVMSVGWFWSKCQ